MIDIFIELCYDEVMMKMMTVYRVQNAEGYGPYSGIKAISDSPDWVVEDNHVEPRHDVFGANIDPDEVCAFSSVHSARKWFNRDLVDILSNDPHDEWYFAMYRVPFNKMRSGIHQVLAYADDTIYCDAVPIKMLYIED